MAFVVEPLPNYRHVRRCCRRAVGEQNSKSLLFSVFFSFSPALLVGLESRLSHTFFIGFAPFSWRFFFPRNNNVALITCRTVIGCNRFNLTAAQILGFFLHSRVPYRNRSIFLRRPIVDFDNAFVSR